MTASLPTFAYASSIPSLQEDRFPALLNGEILLTTRSHTDWGAAVTARMYLPIHQERVWQKITDYSQWVRYFPSITHSQVLHPGDAQASRIIKRLYQIASKNFFLFTAQVDIHLKVIETIQQRVQFYLESGSFNDFYADLHLQECRGGTLLTYSVQATPTIPVPSVFIQQAIQLDLPSNLRNMRQILCQQLSCVVSPKKIMIFGEGGMRDFVPLHPICFLLLCYGSTQVRQDIGMRAGVGATSPARGSTSALRPKPVGVLLYQPFDDC